MSDDDDRPPVARSAHVRPTPKRLAAPASSKRRTGVDPRFDPMFGAVDQRQFEANYKFLREQQVEEDRARRFRIKCLKCVLRRVELEKSGADLAEYDLSDDEREVFGEDHMEELRELKLTPAKHIYEELGELQRQAQLYTAQTKNTAATSRRALVKKELMKKEVEAVKSGVKARPHFPKRSEVHRAVLSDTFDRLEQTGGKIAVDRYLSRKVKRGGRGGRDRQ